MPREEIEMQYVVYVNDDEVDDGFVGPNEAVYTGYLPGMPEPARYDRAEAEVVASKMRLQGWIASIHAIDPAGSDAWSVMPGEENDRGTEHEEARQREEEDAQSRAWAWEWERHEWAKLSDRERDARIRTEIKLA
jgi:hypothetical protein